MPVKKIRKTNEKVEPVEQAGGNRDPSFITRKRNSQHTKMCMTVNNWTMEQKNSIVGFLENNCLKFIIAEEVGENGTPHLQGAFILKTKKRFNEIFNVIGFNFHLEIMKGTWMENMKYCSKDGIFVTNCNEEIPYNGSDIIKKDDLFPYQKEIIDIINTNADNRTIHWYFDRIGNCGKSAITKYLCFHHRVIVISKGKYSDIMNYLFTVSNVFNVVVFDLPRNNGSNISYDALESIKNGIIFNSKYETGQKLFNPPHVIVFANEKPDLEKLSKDRWRINEIQALTKTCSLIYPRKDEDIVIRDYKSIDRGSDFFEI